MPIVIDNGSCYVRSGSAGDQTPKSVISSVINGRPTMLDGKVTDWDSITDLWNTVFEQELQLSPEGQIVLLTESAMNNEASREKMVEKMFDVFKVDALHIAKHAFLSTTAAGVTVGLAIDSGDTVSHVTPVYEARFLPQATRKLYYGGADVTSQLQSQGQLSTSNARWVKEHHCYVAADPQSEPSDPVDVELPDGSQIQLGPQRFLAPELLLDPSYVGKEDDGFATCTIETVSKCDIDIRRTLYGNIVLSGGSCMFPGLAERVQSEIQKEVPPTVKVNVMQPESEFSVWRGGSIVASAGDFRKQCICREDLEEQGVRQVLQKSKTTFR